MNLFAGAVTVLTVATLLSFGWALLSLRRLPVGRRPRVTVYSRTGRPIRDEQLDPPDLPSP